jgi:hypothetical protein
MSDEFVPLRHLCEQLGIDFHRQREKIKGIYAVETKGVFSRNGTYQMLCLTKKDAKDFLRSGGIWVRGPYKGRKQLESLNHRVK